MMTEHMYGDEIEVHSLLVIDQNTFEGKIHVSVASRGDKLPN